MSAPQNLLRGWKAIAAYLAVTPSTAIRWANDGALPVIRTTKGSSVYADPAALGEWLRQKQVVDDPQRLESAAQAAAAPFMPAPVKETPAAPTPAPLMAEHAPVRRRLPGPVLAGIATLAAIATLTAVAWTPSPTANRALITAAPSAEWRDQYLQARLEWARRTPDDIRRAIAQYQAIIARDPSAAKAFIGLADADVLSCEFAGVDRQQAFADARKAITTGLALAPDDADANRIAGFLSYWTDRDIGKAAPYFDKALAAAPNDYLSHLWYGNALVDAGRLRPALAHLDSALTLVPDSAAVQTDYAVALWQAGNETRAMDMLAQVESSEPTALGAWGWSALFNLARGDIASYVAHSRQWAGLIHDPVQIARVDGEARLLREGGAQAVLRAMVAHPSTNANYWLGGDLPRALAASQLSDRQGLIGILKTPEIGAENWRNLRFPAANFVKWRNDPEIKPLLDRAFAVANFENYAR